MVRYVHALTSTSSASLTPVAFVCSAMASCRAIFSGCSRASRICWTESPAGFATCNHCVCQQQLSHLQGTPTPTQARGRTSVGTAGASGACSASSVAADNKILLYDKQQPVYARVPQHGLSSEHPSRHPKHTWVLAVLAAAVNKVCSIDAAGTIWCSCQLKLACCCCSEGRLRPLRCVIKQSVAACCLPKQLISKEKTLAVASCSVESPEQQQRSRTASTVYALAVLAIA
jgi:hypothetical protein